MVGVHVADHDGVDRLRVSMAIEVPERAAPQIDDDGVAGAFDQIGTARSPRPGDGVARAQDR
jgi:hypothetical protein